MTAIVLLSTVIGLLWVAVAVLWLVDQPRPQATVDVLLQSMTTDEPVAAAPTLVHSAA